MTLNRRKIIRGLLKKGFIEESKTKHVRDRFYFRNNSTDIYTTLSRGSNAVDVSDGLFSQMARQCYISAGNFRKLIDCSLSESEYIKLVAKYLPKPTENS